MHEDHINPYNLYMVINSYVTIKIKFSFSDVCIEQGSAAVQLHIQQTMMANVFTPVPLTAHPPSSPGYEQFGLMRSDPALCFRALVGEEGPQTSSSSKKRKGRSAASNQVTGEDDEEEDWSGGDGEESEEEVAPAASHERVRR